MHTPARDRALWLVLALGWAVAALAAADLYPLDPDECDAATTAFDVLAGRLPAWLGGQTHYGAVKAYLDAPLVALFGPQDWTVRVSSWLFRLLHPPLVAATLWVLLGRRAALAGALVAACWPPRLHFWLLGAWPQSLPLALGAALWLAVASAYRKPGRVLRCGFAAGFCSGLALFAAFQSLLATAPVCLGYLLCTHGLAPFGRRLGAGVAGFLVGSCPWWADGLSHGFLRDRMAYLGNSGGAAWGGALSNWGYYTQQILWETMSCEHLTWPLPEWGWTVLTAAAFLACWAAALGCLALLGGPLRPRLGVPLTLRDRDAWWWWCVLGGTTLAWLAAIGFTTPGSWRGPVHRYLIQLFALLPLAVGLVGDFVARRTGRSWPLVALTVALCLPAGSDALASGGARENVKRSGNLGDLFAGRAADAVAARDAVRRALEQVGATYTLGTWWESAFHGFWSGGRIASVILDPFMAVPLWPGWSGNVPRPGPGVLVMVRGGPLERYLSQLHLLDGMTELAGPAAFRLLLIPDASARPGAPGYVLARIGAYGRQGQLFIRGLQDELAVEPALQGDSETLADGSRVFHVRFAPSRALWGGPFLRLPPGRYEVSFDLATTGDAEVRLAVSSAGREAILWESVGPLRAGHQETVRGQFDIELDRFIETEAQLTRLAPASDFTVRGVRLRRLSPASGPRGGS